MNNKAGKVILSLSVPLSILIITASCIGISTPDLYAKETANWQIQSRAQDRIDLFIIVPVLMLTGMLAYRSNYAARLMWAGTIAYISYTFIIYCFDVHFNRLFLIYCFTLGLSFYSLAWFVYSQSRPVTVELSRDAPTKATGIYFLTLSIIFYFLWLRDIVLAIINTAVPKGLEETGLPTNPVHVIDLSLFLPAIFIVGILMIRKRQAGFLLAVIVLTFFILMNITIGWLSWIMKQEGAGSGVSLIIVMALLTLVSIVFLIWNIKDIKVKTT